jgi:hypothetical protein
MPVRKTDKNEYQVKELFLETANHYPWFADRLRSLFGRPRNLKDNMWVH